MKPPEGPAPALVFVNEVDREKGVIIYRTYNKVPVIQTVEEVIEVKGVKQTVIKNRTVFTTEIRESLVQLNAFKAQTADGKLLTMKDLAERLTPGTTILIQFVGDKVDPAYLKVIKGDTIVLYASAPR